MVVTKLVQHRLLMNTNRSIYTSTRIQVACCSLCTNLVGPKTNLTTYNFVSKKVTVCPPKNTYTNLNYDLKYDNNEMLDNETKEHLVDVAFQLLNDNLHQEKIQV